jgi:hypothetical protein
MATKTSALYELVAQLTREELEDLLDYIELQLDDGEVTDEE